METLPFLLPALLPPLVGKAGKEGAQVPVVALTVFERMKEGGRYTHKNILYMLLSGRIKAPHRAFA